jgi:hypothetical protein
VGRVLSPFATTKHPALAWLFSLDVVSLSTEPLDLMQHALQQGVGGFRWYPRSLELEDFLTLLSYLDAHVLDFPSDVV